MRRILAGIMPFLILGIAIVALAFGVMLLVYLFFFGAIIGAILYIFALIKERFFPKPKPKNEIKRGRTIDSDDWRVL